MNERIDWRFSTVPQKYVKDRVIIQPRYDLPFHSLFSDLLAEEKSWVVHQLSGSFPIAI